MPTAMTRHLKLDALRGVAVMGILLMNIIAFSMPSGAYINPQAWGGMEPVNQIVWIANFIVVDAKMRSLFSMLFGASMLLFIDHAEAKGLDAHSLHRRRMTWLLLFGLIHLIFIWNGDILSLYAMVGLIAWRWRALEAKALIRKAIIWIGAGFLLWGAVVGGVALQVAAAKQSGAQTETIKDADSILSEFGAPNSPEIRRELNVYRGSYPSIIAHRIQADSLNPIMLFLTFGPETLGLMALGMALLRNGFFTGEWARRSYWRALALGYGVGLSAMALIALWVVASGYDILTTASAVLLWSLPFRAPIAIGHAALVMLLLSAGPMTARLAAVGQTAFSNYIGTSILMTTYFYGYGLGRFGTMSRAEVYLVVLAVWVVMLIWSKPWMDRYRHGPLEWLWRSLTRREAVPLRR